MGRTLREFLALPPLPHGRAFDQIEREVWRAFFAWEADLCPGCGQPLSETTRKLAPEEARAYTVDVRYCGACKEVEVVADRLQKRDEARAKQLGRSLPTGHRRYSVSLEHKHQ